MIYIILSSYLQSFLCGSCWRNFVIPVKSWSLWRSSVLSVFSGSNSNNSGVNGTGDTVVQLVVSLWQGVFWVDRSFGQISDGSSFNNVSNSHSLDSLILWNGLGTVNTSHWLDVTSTLLVSTVGSSLFWHLKITYKFSKLKLVKRKYRKY